jgi:hypothetical protein
MRRNSSGDLKALLECLSLSLNIDVASLNSSRCTFLRRGRDAERNPNWLGLSPILHFCVGFCGRKGYTFAGSPFVRAGGRGPKINPGGGGATLRASVS